MAAKIPHQIQILPLPPPSGPVSFPSTVLGVWKFDGTLNDEVGQNDFSPTTGAETYTSFDKFELLSNTTLTRKGLSFVDKQEYTVTPNFSYSSDFTIAFWWFSPGIVGFTRHTTKRTLEPKIAPIISKANFRIVTSKTDLKSSSFVVAEVGSSKTENAIRVYLTSDGENVSHVITSESYKPGLVHVLMTYLQSDGRFRIDINGKAGILHSAPTGSLQQIGAFRINSVAPGFLAHSTCQTGGYMFDLVFTGYAATDNESLKAVRYGWEHIAFENLFETRFKYFGISYPQPTTISTTHLFVDGGNIFAARSNGEIVKGDRPIWDKEFSYPNPSSVGQLTTSPTGDGRVAKWSTDGLVLKGVTARI